jgi:hypothetical protein
MNMKNTLIAAFLVIAATGCKKSWLDVNTNPNQPPSATSNFVFANAENTTAANFVSQHETGAYFSAQWTQSNSYIMNQTIFAYLYTNTDFNYWDPNFDNLYDYQYVITNAEKDDQKYLKGPARVMKSFLYQQLVDMYGNLPYSKALTGSTNLAPAFDEQKAVYEDLVKQLDTAITELKANPFASAFASSDIIFKGNTTNWIRFANTLKLRILIRQSRVAGRDAYITGEIAKIVAEGSGLLGAGQDVGINPGFLATAGKTNPYYDRWGYDANGATRSLGRFPRPTKNLFDMLKAADDTFRLKRMAYARGGENGNNPGVSTAAEVSSNYVGTPYGVSSGFTAPSTSAIGPALIVKGQFARNLIIMTAAEAQFLLAEAKERYPSVGFAGTSQSYYEQGVRESFRLVGATNTQATALLTSGKVDADWAASTDKIKAIITQKWIATTNYTGMEAWAEYRRTGYPAIPQSLQVPDPNTRPRRLLYPGTETGSNKVNVDAQGAIDKLTSRLFWDVD